MALKKIKGVRYHKEKVILDDAQFEDCQFIECTLIYAGRTVISLTNSHIEGGRFMLVGAAEHVLSFMAAMYQVAPEMMEATFENIRRHNLPDEHGQWPDVIN